MKPVFTILFILSFHNLSLAQNAVTSSTTSAIQHFKITTATTTPDTIKNHGADPHNYDSLKNAFNIQKMALAEEYAKKEITLLVTKQAIRQYGYFIMCDGKLMIDQQSILAVPGNNGFKTMEDATTVAKLANKKIKQGEMLPTITIEELKTLNIHF